MLVVVVPARAREWAMVSETGSQRGAIGAVALLLAVVSYNPLHANRERIGEVSRAARAAIVCQQGTRRRLDSLYEDGYMYYKSSGFHVFDFGHNGKSHSHAGVSISVAARYFDTKHVVNVYVPRDPLLVGRVGGIRLKSPRVDLTIFSLYLPPSFSDGTSRKVYGRLLDWLTQTMDQLPTRTLPLV